MGDFSYLQYPEIASLLLDIVTGSKVNEREDDEKEPATLKVRRAIANLSEFVPGFTIRFFDEILGEKYPTMEHIDPLLERSMGLRIVGYFYDTKTWKMKSETITQDLRTAFEKYMEVKQ